MPPCFTGKNFSDYCFLSEVPSINTDIKKNTPAEKYSVARAGHFRRPTVIVNPHQYYFLAKQISESWAEIEHFYKKSSLSKSTPQAISDGNRSISIMATRALPELKLLLSTGYKYVLITDIAQFFPSIYTHSIDWALYGKDKVKQSLRKNGEAVPDLGRKLDEYSRYLQANQTIGLPIGPDTSHILAEIIGVAMDSALLANQKKNLVGFRYVDDYVFYFDTIEDAEQCLAKLTQVLFTFELNINATKTKIIPISEISSDYWTHELKSFVISHRAKKQKRDILHFFDVALSIARSNADENVMKFALKKIAAVLIFPQNWKIFEANLLRAAITYPNSIIDVAHILYTYHHHNYTLDKNAIQKTIHTLIRDHGPLGHHSEVAWSLWIAGVLELEIESDISEIVCRMDSSPCLLILLYLHKQGKCPAINNERLKEKSSSPNGVYGDMWLAVYEARVHGFYAPDDNPFKGTFFADLENAKVKFFDFSRRLKPLFKILDVQAAESLLSGDKDSYDENDFEFDDIPDDYFDQYREDEHHDSEYRIRDKFPDMEDDDDGPL